MTESVAAAMMSGYGRRVFAPASDFWLPRTETMTGGCTVLSGIRIAPEFNASTSMESNWTHACRTLRLDRSKTR